MTKIATCKGCKPHAYQDVKYGKEQRVYNLLEGKKKGWRCTVCKREILE